MESASLSFVFLQKFVKRHSNFNCSLSTLEVRKINLSGISPANCNRCGRNLADMHRSRDDKVQDILIAIGPVATKWGCDFEMHLCFCRAMLCKRGLRHHAVSVRPSVYVSVTFVDHFKTNKHINKKFSPSGSHAILVFPCQTG